MTVTNLGLNNQPVKFLGAYVKNVSTSLGLTSSPSTCNVSLVEDPPSVTFEPPSLGKYYELQVGSRFKFGGIVTKYDRDVRNISGRLISVHMSDPREIMRSIPIIIAPGFRHVAGKIVNTNCSCIDIFGAYDDFQTTGVNLSGWNQAGMEIRRILSAFKGEDIILPNNFVYRVERRECKAFGERYRFNFDEVVSRIDGTIRINTNLISVGDFCQELANRSAFDWYTECERAPDGAIEVTIKPIDRRTDNIDVDLDSFLSDYQGRVITARSGVELRNDIAISVLLGAPVESIQEITIEGLANEAIDLSEEGGSTTYYMTEDEMRVVLAGKQSWETWLSIPTDIGGGGGFSRYGAGLSDEIIASVFDDAIEAVKTQQPKNPKRNNENLTNQQRENAGKIFEKLKGHAENTYGKRFVFSNVYDVDKIDAAWTIGVVAGNSDADEYFRNEQGKTRCYVEFSSDAGNSFGLQADLNNIFGNGAGQILPGTAGFQTENSLVLYLENSFQRNNSNVTNWTTEADKKNWIVDSNGRLFVAATIEDNSNIVRLDAPIIQGKPNPNELLELLVVKLKRNSSSALTADGDTVDEADKAITGIGTIFGGHAESLQIWGRCYQPKKVYLPTRSKYLRYGPVFSSTLNASSEGKLEIEVDDGFCPWEFGGYSTMLDAMQIKVDNQSSSVREVQTADITVEGFPDFSIGESLGRNSNINNINISFGDQVTTQYQLQSFLRKFGELSKEDLARLSLFMRRGGARNLPQDTVAFIDKYRTRINRQFSGRGSSPGAATTGGVDSFE